MRHNLQPTDTEGHSYQCERCGKEISKDSDDYDVVLEEECNLSHPLNKEEE